MSPYQATSGRSRRPTRQAGDAGIIEEHRLDHNVGAALDRGRLPRGLEMRRAKAQQPVAVARGRLGEQHHRLSLGHRPRDFPVDARNTARAPTIDENDALQSRQPAAQRRGADLLLGQERHRLDRGENRNIEPGDMIGDDQPGRAAAGAPVNAHAYAERRAEQAIERGRRPTAGAPVAPQGEAAQRRADQQKQPRRRMPSAKRG